MTAATYRPVEPGRTDEPCGCGHFRYQHAPWDQGGCLSPYSLAGQGCGCMEFIPPWLAQERPR